MGEEKKECCADRCLGSIKRENDHIAVSHMLDYLNFKDLMDIAGKYHKFFDKSYDLYITEVLPGNKYRTNKVKLPFN